MSNPQQEWSEAYQRFRSMYADSLPMRGAVAFQLALHAAGLRPSEVTDEWLRALRDDWVYGSSDEPFTEEHLNRAYRDAARQALGL